MALDFPTAPTNGQKYPASPVIGVPTYTWDGEKWTTKSDALGDIYAKKAGDTMTGHLSLPVSPAADQAVRKDYVDAATTTLQNNIGQRVAVAGDTMTGNLNIAVPGGGGLVVQPTGAGWATLDLKKTGSGNVNVIRGYTGTNPTTGLRWLIGLGGTGAESGSNAGSDFYLDRYSDTGAWLSTPISIPRSSGTVTLSNGLYSNGDIYSTAALSCAGNCFASTFYPNAAYAISWASGTASLYSDTGGTAFYTNGTGCYFSYTKATGLFQWVVNNTQMMRVEYSAGNLIIPGNAWKLGGGTWNDVSDIRIKNVEGEYKAGLAEIVKLRPIIYTFKGNDTLEPPSTVTFAPDDPKSKDAVTVPYPNSDHGIAAANQTKFYGLIAQEVEPVFPEMVSKRDGYIDGVPVNDLRNLDTTPLIYALVNAVKELKARVEMLEAA